MSAARVRFIEHKGKRILFHDFSNIATVEEALAAVRESRAIVSQQPPASLLTLTDVSHSRFNKDVVDALKELVAANKPHVRAGAIVGLSGLQRIVYVAVTQLTGRRLPTFGTQEEAKDWLVAQ